MSVAPGGATHADAAIKAANRRKDCYIVRLDEAVRTRVSRLALEDGFIALLLLVPGFSRRSGRFESVALSSAEANWVTLREIKQRKKKLSLEQ
jgi:hypothetical protein